MAWAEAAAEEAEAHPSCGAAGAVVESVGTTRAYYDDDA